jgi:hypothetical protein
MNRKPYESVLRDRHGAEQAAKLATQMESEYQMLFADRPQYDSAAMQTHVDDVILPGLALYRALLVQGMTSEAAKDELGQILGERWRSKTAPMMNFLKRLPGTFALFRWMGGRRIATQFGEPGFSMEWVENSPQRVAFNMTRCLYYNVLSDYDATDLTSIFCDLDDVIYGQLEPKVSFKRTGTIGRGQELCDFCFTPRQA